MRPLPLLAELLSLCSSIVMVRNTKLAMFGLVGVTGLGDSVFCLIYDLL
jgi:hypothetical protein